MAKFKPGESGNPNGKIKGTLNKRTELAKLLDPHGEALISKTIEMALAGDTTALRLCVERIFPKPQRGSTGIELPKILNEKTLPKLQRDILQAAVEGRISMDDAERLKNLIVIAQSKKNVILKIDTTDPIEASKIYQSIMTGKYSQT